MKKKIKAHLKYIGLLSALILATNVTAQENKGAESTGTGPTAVSFSDNGQSLKSGSGWTIQLVDINADGTMDAYFDGAIWLNDGRAHFNRTDQSFGDAERPAAFTDFNSDGFVDAVCDNVVYFNDGQHHFTQNKRLPTDVIMADVLLADLDGDTDVDIIVSGSYEDRILLNDGKGHFTDSSQLLGTAPGGSALAADFNGDGSLDVFIARGAPLDNGKPNLVWLNGGKGQFTDSGLRLGNSNSITAAVGDLNGDGKPDVFVANMKNMLTQEGAGINEVWLNTTENQRRSIPKKR